MRRVLLSFHLSTLVRKGVSMETNRTTSRRALALIQIWALDGTRILFRTLVVLSHGSRPYPSVIGFPRLRERSRFSCPGAIALRSHGALLEQVYQIIQSLSRALLWERVP